MFVGFCWFIHPMKYKIVLYIYICIYVYPQQKPHSSWSYVHRLSDQTGAPPSVVIQIGSRLAGEFHRGHRACSAGSGHRIGGVVVG